MTTPPPTTLEAALAEIGRLRAERDKLIEGLITRCNHGWFWEFRPEDLCDFAWSRDEAIAAVREAAGLPTEE